MPPTQRKPRITQPGPAPDSESFVYTAPNGKTITLPSMAKALNAAELRRLRKSEPMEIVYHVLERDHPDQLEDVDAALESMSIDEDVPALMEQWREWSRASMGESSAS